MSVKKAKFSSNYLLRLFLVTAFLTMQWTPAHVHLSEHHEHDGLHHQHQTETHAHNLDNQSIAIDVSNHQTSHANVIVHDCNFPTQDKQKNFSTANPRAPPQTS